MSEPKKKFRLFDAVLSVICVVFVAEAAAPVAAIGNSQYFWWIFLICTFLLPYGLIAAELGTTYEGDGGLYDWVKRAFGTRWGARVSWYYWINFPLWMASLALIFPEVLGIITGQTLGTGISILIEMIFIWGVVFISFFKVSDSKWILNISALIKVGLALLLAGLGIYVAATRGVANEMTLTSMLPSFDVRSLSFISVILFNFMGFEVMASFTGDMENPKKELPKAIIAGGIAIAAIYIISAFGIGVAIPADQVTPSSGLIDSIQILTGQMTGPIITFAGVMFLITLLGNMVSWSLGVNYVAMYAAQEGDMPRIFAKEDKKRDIPTGAPIMNGLVATAVIILARIIPSEDIFWSFFALNIVTLLMSYIPVFPAFLKLRKIDPNTERPFRVSGGPLKLKLMVGFPVLFLIISILFSIVPLDTSSEELIAKIPLAVGVVIAVIIGEIIAAKAVKNEKAATKNKITPAKDLSPNPTGE